MCEEAEREIEAECKHHIAQLQEEASGPRGESEEAGEEEEEEELLLQYECLNNISMELILLEQQADVFLSPKEEQ